ncbi:putative WRKY transcription factor 3 [Acorus calamus]|uniref:WRKY transcription factor 3 n=1 Tax=Acorus calamus TaxID=4465 RepID=A0AAV9CRI5_ACOCL|nr:putative WRKY transcription factor 3 [Acorus calamus]
MADTKEDQPDELVTVKRSASDETLTDSGDCRTFSQLLAGAMASSPTGGGKTEAKPTVPILAVPVVAIPCFIAPAPLLESAGFQVSNDSARTPEAEQQHSTDQESQSAQVNLKATCDGYNWRKYGQKQVKSSENSRSYYKCTHARCSVKKKVERCLDGRITEITYRGQHNHEPPQKIRSSKERGAEIHGGDETTGNPSEKHLSDAPMSTVEESPLRVTPEPQVHCSSDEDGDADIKAVEKHCDEPDPKRRLTEPIVTYSAPLFKAVKEPKVVVQTACDTGLVADGYRWRKYGQKFVKGNPNPRSYYKCTYMGCSVRKHVERASEDAKAFVITYEGKHTHELPAPRNSHNSPTTTILSDASKYEKTSITNSKPNKHPSRQRPPPEKYSELTDNKALELGGEKALESAQTLLSISFTSTSEEGGARNADANQPPVFNENHAAVSI